jgi:hypothetical protein
MPLFLILLFSNLSSEFYLPFSIPKHTNIGAKDIFEKLGIRISITSVHFCQFHSYRIRIRESQINADPDSKHLHGHLPVYIGREGATPQTHQQDGNGLAEVEAQPPHIRLW